MLLLIALHVLTCGSASAGTQRGDNRVNDRAVIAEFQAKVRTYSTLHRRLPRVPRPGTDAAQIAEHQSSYASTIRGARANASEGDIFTRDVQEMFRRLLRPWSHVIRAAQDDDADDAEPGADLTLQVNGAYPPDMPLSRVPTEVLRRLPPLPADLQYRFVGDVLVLYDARVDLIVDFMHHAID